MARRRGKAPPPKPFVDAEKGIDTLEQNVWNRTNDPGFTAQELVHWLLPAGTVDKLQAAYPLIRAADRTQYWNLDVTLPLAFPAQRCNFTIKANSPEVRMLVPENGVGVSNPLHPSAGYILESIREAYGVHERFEKVRKVVRWLNEYATVGAARHYCPWLHAVLPHDHPFQEASGQTYREPRVSMIGIAGAMRESGAIMASALLCGEPEDKTRNVFSVTFNGTRDNDGEYNSNSFAIL